MATAAYRRLLRATRDLFREDTQALIKSRAEIRSHFEKSRAVTNPTEIRRLLADAQEAEDFINRHLVQARKTQRGTYAVTLKDPDAEEKRAQNKQTHTNFEPLAPQEAIERSTTGPKKPQVVSTASSGGCCGGHSQTRSHSHSHPHSHSHSHSHRGGKYM